ncbi:neugrin isoform X2 [Pseudophryne corroboree]|uniref:neugrin isoform X2 n=1 Tax=Pseudophryne corroboree TaxID=495146 RepID=UPI0030819CA2
MAASLLSFVVRGLRIFSSSHASLPGCRRILTRPPFRPVPGADSNVESDAESEEDEERAIERYLRQEFPEEWTLQRLAVGFNVSTDVIKKVLKSKFVPPEVRKMKQDASVSKLLGQISTGSRIDHLQLRSPAKDSAQQLLPFGGDESRLLVSQSSQVLPPPKTSDSSLVTLRSGSPQNNVPKSLVRKQESQNAMPGVISAVSEVSLATSGMVEPAQSAPVEPDQVVLNEKWDGEVLSDHQLEDLANSGLQNSMKVEQKGREFFDSNGNFLYRI